MRKPIQTDMFDVSNIRMSKEKSSDIDLDYEIQLLYAMQGFKPVGISRHFQMSCIIERLQENMEKAVNSKSIWEHLNKWYNLQQLNENETTPFQNQEIDFNLPEIEFGSLKQKKSSMPVVKTTPLPNTPDKPSTPVSTQSKSSTSTFSVNKKTIESTPKDSTTKHMSTSQKEETKKDATLSSSKNSSSQRRDSFSQKLDQSKSSNNSSKKDFNQPGSTSAKKVIEKRGGQNKGRNQNTPSTSSSKTKSSDTDKIRDHNKNTEKDEKDNPASVKRTTRGSLKPDESLNENSKSQSPLTISTPTSSGGSAPKRRRI